MGSGASKPDSSNPTLTVNTFMDEDDFINMGAANYNNQGGVQIKDSSDIINSKKEIMKWLKENYTVDNNFFNDEDFADNINELWRNDKQNGGGVRKKRKRKTRRKKNKNSTRKRNRKKIKSKKKKRGRKKSRKKR